MDKLDEASLRRPTFEPGHAVELADGQPWTIPPVRIRIYPDDGGAVHWRPWYGGDLEADLDVIFGVVPAEGYLVIEAKLKIAAALLRRNYDLPAGAAGTLLTYIPSDGPSAERFRRVGEAIMGRDPDADEPEDQEGDDPKARAGGSDAAAITPGSS